MPSARLVDHLHVERRGLIVHAPSAVYEFNLPGMHQRAHLFLFGGRLVPPACKECRLDPHELAVTILREPRQEGVQDVVDLVEKVLVHCDLPADIIMRMGDQVHVDLFSTGLR